MSVNPNRDEELAIMGLHSSQNASTSSDPQLDNPSIPTQTTTAITTPITLTTTSNKNHDEPAMTTHSLEAFESSIPAPTTGSAIADELAESTSQKRNVSDVDDTTETETTENANKKLKASAVRIRDSPSAQNGSGLAPIVHEDVPQNPEVQAEIKMNGNSHNSRDGDELEEKDAIHPLVPNEPRKTETDDMSVEDDEPLIALKHDKKSVSTSPDTGVEKVVGSHTDPSSPPSILETVGMSKSKRKRSAPPDEIVSQYIELLPIPDKAGRLSRLSQLELAKLESTLEIGKTESWRDDWIGNLAFADAEILNPDGKPFRGPRKTLMRWAEKGPTSSSFKILHTLLRYVYNLEETPPSAKKILGATNSKSWTSLHHAIRRVSYDPTVLREDGWTTAKSKIMVGATGGPHRIGEMVYWQGYEGVIIAYLHDNDLGDLWKAMWLEEFDTFDLEAEELEDARRKYERKKQKYVELPSSKASSKQVASDEENKKSSAKLSSSTRFSTTADFFVQGIEHGIVLATSYSRGSRSGVFWPARVMHASEMPSYGTQGKRGSSRQKIDVIFLAPYWNAAPIVPGSRRGVESYADTVSRLGSSVFSSGPLFEMESIDASAEVVQEYPYDMERGLDINQLRVSFKFSGLPKAAFPRFVDSHRLALGLKTFSQIKLKSTVTELDRTTAGLFEVHPLAVHTALFPTELLHLPFGYILSQMPIPKKEEHATSYDDDPQSSVEPALQLTAMLDSMKPPMCWGKGESSTVPNNSPQTRAFASPPIPLKLTNSKADTPVKIDSFITDLSSLQQVLTTVGKSSVTPLLVTYLDQFLSKLPKDYAESEGLSVENRRAKAKLLVSSWTLLKVR
jgi:hypothetical protein